MNDNQHWQKLLRKQTGYDPSKYAHLDRLPDKDMEASAAEQFAEERRTAMFGKYEDKMEYQSVLAAE